MVLPATPVPSVEGVAADEVERAGDVPSAARRHHQGDPVGHGLPDEGEEAAVQVRTPPFPAAGVHVEREEGVPVFFSEVAAGEDLDVDVRVLADLPALPADLLSFAGREVGQEIVERGVPLVEPVELLAGALEQPGGAALPPLLLGQKRDVEGRDLEPPRHFDASRQGQFAVRLPVRVVPGQEPRTRHRRERHRQLELGVVPPARPLEGVGPAVVEHVLAHRVGLRVERRRRPQRPVRALHRHVIRRPAGLGAHAAALLQRLEKGVGQEGVVAAGAGVPLGGVDPPDVVDGLDGRRRLFDVTHGWRSPSSLRRRRPGAASFSRSPPWRRSRRMRRRAASPCRWRCGRACPLRRRRRP